MSVSINKLCSICGKKDHRYTCPRCNICYCSLECYKNEKHADCSEKFYKEWFVTEMKERKVSDAEKHLLMEMIRKTEEENPILDFLNDDDEEVSLEERLRGLNIQELKDDQLEELWNRLNAQEQEEFRSLTKSGSVSSIKGSYEVWKPFWFSHDPSLVIEVRDENLDQKIHLNLPPILTVPSLQEMAVKKPLSQFIGFNLINVLFSYVFFQRLYDGCGTSDFLLDFCDACISSSKVLKENRTYGSADESLCCSLQSCSEIARKQSLSFEKRFSTECIHDVSHVLMGPNPQSAHHYACCCLSDLHTVCKKLRKSESGNQQFNLTQSSSKEMRKLLFRTEKKLEFLVAWCSEHHEQLTLLAIETTELYKNKLSDFKTAAEMERHAKDMTKISTCKHVSDSENKTQTQLIVELP